MARANGERLKDALCIAGAFVSVLYIVMITDRVFRLDLNQYGILPRSKSGLIGIVFSPLLHGGLGHLIANTLSLFILMTILFWDKRYQPASTLALIWAASGLGTWLIGRADGPHGPTVHIGASGVIYGLITYLIAAGFWMRSWRAAFIAVLVFLFYGGAAFGVLPRDGMVSWEGHLCGAIAGIWAAWGQHAK
ncbi:MAG: rhomboid family intramembrane serine protease [Verrucomicrobiota bacterium]